MQKLEEALKHWRQAKYLFGVGEVLDGLTDLYFVTSDWPKAHETGLMALAIWQQLNNLPMQLWTQARLGWYYRVIGESQKAVDSFLPALSYIQKEDYPEFEAQLQNELASSYFSLGLYQKAANALQQAISIEERIKTQPRQQAESWLKFGRAHRFLKNTEKQFEYFQKCLGIARQAKLKILETQALISIGNLYRDEGNIPKSIEYFNKALDEIPQNANSINLKASIYRGLGNSFQALGEKEKAINFYYQAIEILQTIQNLQAAAFTYTELGSTYRVLGNYSKALEAFEKAQTLFTYQNGSFRKTRFLFEYARLEKDLGHLDEALKKITESLRLLENLRTSISIYDFRTLFFSSIHQYYEFYIDLLLELHQKNPTAGYDTQAFQASEQARARSLLDLLTESRIDIRKGVPKELTESQDDLSQRLRDKTAAVLTLYQEGKSQTLIASLEKEIEQLTADYETVTAKIRAQSPVYASLTQPQPLGLKAVQEQVLDADTLLLEFFLGPERSHLWLVSSTAIEYVTLPKRSDIEPLVQEVYQTLTRPSAPGGKSQTAAAALSRLLLGPVAGKLGAKRLLIAADGDLQALPFAILPEPLPGKAPSQPLTGKLLLENHEIVNLPSASTLALLRSQETKPALTESKTLAVFADPVFEPTDERVRSRPALPETQVAVAPPVETDLFQPDPLRDVVLGSEAKGAVIPRLRFTRTEAQEIAKSLASQTQVKQALDFDASLEQVTQADLSQFRILHFATHGLFNRKQPALSGVLLSLVKPDGTKQNGFLGLPEIFKLKLQAEMVVLSSCQSGLGQTVAGEGLVGLTRGFMYAGTPRVVASLWSVNDQATAELMKYFYDYHLGPKRMAPAAALRAAQLQMRKQSRWHHPFFWAAFTIQGEYH
ncbi:MAG: CHAT domain-containing protein [Blastocatellia bacterium]|nr:CHAT domain-containing protein [Blastocatellia bacterium]